MNNLTKKWFEVWYVEGVELLPVYLVVVAPNPEAQNEILVTDYKNNNIIYRGESYEDVHNWLTEDEFGFVTGRVYEF